jgi:SAM-dependent methyltransferase
MDGPDTDYETFRDCLRDLARVNVLSLGYRPTLAFLEGLRRSGRIGPARPVEILDAGSGYGDLLRAVDRWGARHGLDLRLTGVDLNSWSARAAAEATLPGRPIRWVTGDIFGQDRPADVVVSSLFTHHLDDALLVRFLRWMEDRARLGWFINDLHRHPIPAVGFGPLAAILRFHRFVRHDGPVSFRRAFVPGDWHRLLREAGVPKAVAVERWFPFRLCAARAKVI